MKSVADKILEGTLKDQINLMKLSEFEKMKAETLLVATWQKIVKQIISDDPTAVTRTLAQKQRLQKLYTNVNTIVKDNFKNMSEQNKELLLEMAGYEAEISKKIVDDAIGVPVMGPDLSLHRIKSVVNNSMIDGALIGNWWNKQSKEFMIKFKDTMSSIMFDFQTGVLQGQTLGSMITAMSPSGSLMGLTRKNVEAVIRTSYVTVADGIRQEVFEENKDIMKGERWNSTFDLRTTPICIKLHNNEWDLNKKNIKGGMSYRRPPAHWQCRSVMQMITKSYEEILGIKPQVKQLSTEQRAAMNGPVSADLSYSDWVKTLPKNEQIDIMGKSRYNLFSNGKLSITDMINNKGNFITVKELRAKNL